MLKNKILPTVVLVSICVCVAMLLSLTNIFTTEVIEKAQAEKVNATLRVVYPDGESFEPIDTEGKGLPESIGEAYAANDGGYVFKSTVKGYKSGLTIMIGIDASGAVTDTKYVASNETYGAEELLDGMYSGMTADEVYVEKVSNASYTTKGYTKAVNDAFSAYSILKGGASQ